ncbi:MAG: D-alanyl-D-alanine carboxypeptidase/D-alanyl-D-alanine-endopeptidase [Planctomycetaceae bacterium]
MLPSLSVISCACRRVWTRPLRSLMLVLLAAACVGIAPTARAQAPLPADALTVIEAPEYRHSLWGVLVVDLETGEPLHSLNADKLFTPASVTKLFSVAAALDALGPDFRVETPVVRRGEVDSQGVLRGDLILLGSGDPTLGGRTLADGSIAFTNNDHTYANGSEKGALTSPNPLAGLNELARQIADRGIRQVTGRILVDNRLFDEEPSTGSGPTRVSPVLVNDSLVDLTISPSLAGQGARLETRPECRFLRIDNRLETGPAGSPLSVTLQLISPHELVVTGRIAADSRSVLRVAEMPQPASFARSLFIEALDRAGVRVTASALVRQDDADLDGPRSELAKLPVVARLESPPFTENARLILKVSHNLHASTLPLLLASRQGKRTLAQGLHRQHDLLQGLGVDVETISFGGGAGGSQADCVTPQATVELLRAMHKHRAAEAFRRALPVLGVDGTLAEAVSADSPARGRVQAKTGTYFWENTLNQRYLLTSKSLAGDLQGASGRPLAFALFLNRAHIEKAGDTAIAGKALGRICEALHAAH